MSGIPFLRVRLNLVATIILSATAIAIWVAPVPKLKLSSGRPAFPPAVHSLPTQIGAPDLHELIARPLFAQTRRPPPPAPIARPIVTVTQKPVPTTNGMVLLGILHTDTKTIALVTIPGDLYPRQVTAGMALGDWVIKKILNDRLMLQSGDTNSELVIPSLAAPPTTSASPPNSPSFPTPFWKVP